MKRLPAWAEAVRSERAIRQGTEQIERDIAVFDMQQARGVLEKQECVKLRHLGFKLQDIINEIKAHDPREDSF